MKKKNIERKKKEFVKLSGQFNQLLSTNQWGELSESQQLRWKTKLNKLFFEVRKYFKQKELRRIVAALAIFLGVNGTVTAQSFAAPVQNPFSLTTVGGPYMQILVDIDDDGDLDLFLDGLSNILYYENSGTPSLPDFNSPYPNPFNFTINSGWFNHVVFGDLDDDGDVDIICNDVSHFLLEYIENVGTPSQPSFSIRQSTPFGLVPGSLNTKADPAALVDIDDDGDLDLFVTYYGDVEFRENIGNSTNPHFDTPQVNPFGINLLQQASNPQLTFGDLDHDGDLDLICGSDLGDILYSENVGNATSPSFGLLQDNPFGLINVPSFSGPAIGDMDADGDVDLLTFDTTSTNYSGVQLEYLYFENIDPTTSVLEKEEAMEMVIYPNPVANQVNINWRGKCVNEQGELKVYDVTGRLVKRVSSVTNQSTLNLVDLPVGLYHLELKVESEKIVSTFIKE